MTERSSYLAGTPSWVDVTTPDLDGAIKFYGDLFGWDIEKGDEEFGYYSMASLRGKTVAGIGPMPPGSPAPPAWSTYLASDDAEATAKHARDAGATILMEPMQVGPAGKMFYALDPTGAGFGVWQAGEHTGAQLVNEPGTLCWNELHTSDVAKSEEFYGKLFGYEFEAVPDLPPDMNYAMFQVANEGVAGRMPLDPGSPTGAQPHWLSYFMVDDCDQTTGRVAELGGTVLRQPVDAPYGRNSLVRDPWGATFSVLQAPAQPS